MPRSFFRVLAFGWDLLHYHCLQPNDSNLDMRHNHSCRTTLDKSRGTLDQSFREGSCYFHILRVRVSVGESSNFGGCDEHWSAGRHVVRPVCLCVCVCVCVCVRV